MTEANVPRQRPLPTKCANLSCPNRPGEGEFVTLTYDVPREFREDRHGHRPVELLVCSPCASVMIYPVALLREVALLGDTS